MSSINYVNENLFVEDVSIEAIAGSIETPFYCYSTALMVQRYRDLREALKLQEPTIYYAVKANSNIHIIKTLKSRFNDLGCDCSSPGELFAAKKAGFNLSDCVYTGNYESFEDLQTAYDAGPEINLDDLNSFERLKKIGIPDYISFRLNPGRGHGQFKGIITGGRDSKFGIPKEKIVNAYDQREGKQLTRYLHNESSQ